MTLDHLEDALRRDGDIDYAVFPSSLYCGTERYFRTACQHELADTWFPPWTALVERLEAGSPANVSFRVADAIALDHGPFDVLVLLDALHDLGDPPAALLRARDQLVPGGVLVAVEPWSFDRLGDGIGPFGRRQADGESFFDGTAASDNKRRGVHPRCGTGGVQALMPR